MVSLWDQLEIPQTHYTINHQDLNIIYLIIFMNNNFIIHYISNVTGENYEMWQPQLISII